MAQGGVIPTLQHLDLHLAPLLLRHAAQLPQGFERRLENFLPAIRLSQQRHSDRPGLPQKDRQRPPLLGVEIGKAVNKNILAAGVSGVLQTVAQLRHPIPGVHARLPQTSLISAVQQTQVTELVMGRSRDILGLGVQILRRDLITP